MTKFVTLHDLVAADRPGVSVAADLDEGVVDSDVRMKEDIVPLGQSAGGLELYRFRYIGGTETYVGVMAHEVAAVDPEAVVSGSDGYLRVNYTRLGLRMMTWDEWRAGKPQ